MSDDLYIYNGLDTTCTFEARNQFWNDLEVDGHKATYARTVRLLEPLLFMMTRGIRVDHTALEETSRDIIKARDAAQLELNRLVGRELNASSPKQVQTYFYIEKGIEPYRGKEGQITADDRALQRLARGTAKRKGLREAKLIQDIRGYETLRGRYLEIQFDSDSRLRGAYNPRGTKFGRLSSGETVFGTGCNLQAMPQEFKKFLVPDEGYVFVEKDKRQAEWVVVAYVSGDARMLQVIEEKRDPHTFTGAMMLREQLPTDLRREATIEFLEDLVKYEAKVVGMLTDEDEIRSRRLADAKLKAWTNFMPRTMSVRQCGKKANHGLNYDEQARMFALINEILESEAAKIVKLYHQVYPGVHTNFHEWIKQQLNKNDRVLENCFGRRIKFLDQWGSELWKAAYSAIPQSTVVDGLNQGMCDIYEDASLTEKANIDLLAQTHDSNLIQIPISEVLNGRLWDISRRMDAYLEPSMSYGGRTFKIATDTKIGWNWSGFHPEANPIGLRELPECANKVAFDKAVFDSCGLRAKR